MSLANISAGYTCTCVNFIWVCFVHVYANGLVLISLFPMLISGIISKHSCTRTVPWNGLDINKCIWIELKYLHCTM